MSNSFGSQPIVTPAPPVTVHDPDDIAGPNSQCTSLAAANGNELCLPPANVAVNPDVVQLMVFPAVLSVNCTAAPVAVTVPPGENVTVYAEVLAAPNKPSTAANTAQVA